jgi:hypothetical protein
MPFTLHATVVFRLPVTIAAYCAEVPSVTLVGPLTTRLTAELAPLPPGACGGAVRTTARPFETEASATLVAVIVTFEG